LRVVSPVPFQFFCAKIFHHAFGLMDLCKLIHLTALFIDCEQ